MENEKKMIIKENTVIFCLLFFLKELIRKIRETKKKKLHKFYIFSISYIYIYIYIYLLWITK